MDSELTEYGLTYMNTKNKNGGGVALYMDKSFNYKVVEGLTTAVDDVLECITIEICIEKKKNVTVSCIYRAPRSNIEIFTKPVQSK